jgi:hypothetical protein
MSRKRKSPRGDDFDLLATKRLEEAGLHYGLERVRCFFRKKYFFSMKKNAGNTSNEKKYFSFFRRDLRIGARIVRALLERGIFAATFLILLHLDLHEIVALWLMMPDVGLLKNLGLKEIKALFWRFEREPLHTALRLEEHPRFELSSPDQSWHWSVGPDDWKKYAERMRDQVSTPNFLLAERYFLKNNFDTSRDFLDHLNFHSVGKASHIFNPVYNLILLHAQSSDLTWHGITRVESFCSTNFLPKVIYEIIHPLSSYVMHSWSPDGIHLLMVEKNRTLSTADIMLFRYCPDSGTLRMLSEITPLGGDKLKCPSHLVSPHLWLNEKTFVLPLSSSEIKTVVIDETMIYTSETKILRRDKSAPENGCFMVSPAGSCLAYLETCVTGKKNFFVEP